MLNETTPGKWLKTMTIFSLIDYECVEVNEGKKTTMHLDIIYHHISNLA